MYQIFQLDRFQPALKSLRILLSNSLHRNQILRHHHYIALRCGLREEESSLTSGIAR